MSPGEKNIVRSLVAVAWADGKLEGGETGVIEGLLCGFDATEAEESEILAYAKTRRELDEIPIDEMTDEDRELLLSNAALLTHADGEQTERERAALERLIALLGFSKDQADTILESAKDGALNLGTKPLIDEA